MNFIKISIIENVITKTMASKNAFKIPCDILSFSSVVKYIINLFSKFLILFIIFSLYLTNTAPIFQSAVFLVLPSMTILQNHIR